MDFVVFLLEKNLIWKHEKCSGQAVDKKEEIEGQFWHLSDFLKSDRLNIPGVSEAPGIVENHVTH